MVCPVVINTLCVYDMQILCDVEPAESEFASVAFGPEGTVLYSSPLLQMLVEFDHEQDRVLRNINMQCCALGVSMCGRVVAFADVNGSVGLLRYQEDGLILLQGTTSCFNARKIFLSYALLSATHRNGNFQMSFESCCNLVFTATDVCRPTTG